MSTTAEVPASKFIFFYNEYGVPGHIEYSIFPMSTTGSVCVERALEVAAKYVGKGHKIILGQDPKGRQLPFYADERLPFFAGLFEFEDKKNGSRANLLKHAVIHPGWPHLKSILDSIPKQEL